MGWKSWSQRTDLNRRPAVYEFLTGCLLAFAIVRQSTAGKATWLRSRQRWTLMDFREHVGTRLKMGYKWGYGVCLGSTCKYIYIPVTDF